MSKLIFDIETVGEDFDALDETTQEVLTRWLQKESESEEEYKVALEELKSGLGFSPLTGQIVAIGTLDYDTGKGGVYFQSPGQTIEPFEENDIKFKPMSEKEMLEQFWKLANHYNEFVSFNGRGFDAPFLSIRSAVHRVRPTKDLMRGRYLYQQGACLHVDLQDQMTFYGAMRKKGALHLWCRAFGIKSPKADGVSGDDVGRLFREKKFVDIARYNVGDLYATKELYTYWDQYMRFS